MITEERRIRLIPLKSYSLTLVYDDLCRKLPGSGSECHSRYGQAHSERLSNSDEIQRPARDLLTLLLQQVLDPLMR
jgi:hypothetical protein